MAYIEINNFKYGLDTRRSELTSNPGSLVTLDNAHINQGGEIEKRLAFVRTALPAGTYGAEDTSAGVVVFGSDADPGGWPRGPVVAYQRLQHPAVLLGSAYYAPQHAMTGVDWSTSYQGVAYVSAAFADGKHFLYYNGAIVREITNGQVLSNGVITPGYNAYDPNLAHDLATEVSLLPGWLGVDGTSDALAKMARYYPDINNTLFGAAEIKSPPGVTFRGILTKVTASTNAKARHLTGYELNVTTPAAVPGTGTYVIAGGAGGHTWTIRVPWESKTSFTAGLLDDILLCNNVLFNTTNQITSNDIVTAINAGTVDHGFSAANGGGTTTTITITNPSLTALLEPPGNYTWDTALGIHFNGATIAQTTITFSASTYGVAIEQGDLVVFTDIGTSAAWAPGDSWTLSIVATGDPNFTDITLGAGRVSGKTFSYGSVFGQRVFLANGLSFNASSIGDPTGFEEQDLDTAQIPYASQFGSKDSVVSFASYQGRLAVFGRRTVQIWQTGADPAADFLLQQTLSNIGAVSALSTQSLGDLDVLFLSDTGVRSLRVRDSSGNATSTDLGSPVDSLIQTALTAGHGSSACSIVEPSLGRYWLYLEGVIYVLSYFPSARIVAWSTYHPTYRNNFTLTLTTGDENGTMNLKLTRPDGTVSNNIVNWDTDAATTAAGIVTLVNAGTGSHGYVASSLGAIVIITPPSTVGNFSNNCVPVEATPEFNFTLVENQVPFTPLKFLVSAGKTYARSADAIFTYGGTTAICADGSTTTVLLPFLDGKRPATKKTGLAIDVALTGEWVLSECMDPVSATFNTAYDSTLSSFDGGVVGVTDHGTHFAMKAVSAATGPAKISSLIFHYTLDEETV